ncbi:glycosyltransferase [Arenibacter sp. F20364]|uniref:glycosyltransferase n=1 Tax=Arenibacter sp. F20364 TaxID=2926415 RepID=UPI001FF27DE1|nr:glycosyltransferase [Arenibacter sp. F20364]MCK0192562.1 glycosyltransferase [Arenibacter sp. F20364]
MDDYNKNSGDLKSPLVSIIIPVYNVENYLNRCIDSIVNQTYSNIEVLLINDGSTDGSGKLCEKLEAEDKRIKVVHQLNSGSSIARNKGLEIAQGEYICFVDSDDWIELNMIEVMLSYALKTGLKLIECGSIESNQNKESKSSFDSISIETREVAMERIIKNLLFAVWRRIYHKSLVENKFFIPNKIHQDVFYTIDIVNNINEIGFIDYPFYNYNVENTDSVIRGKYTLQKLNAIDAGLYVVEQTKTYNQKINLYARMYLVKFLTLHYDQLFFNNGLDKDFSHRKKIKKLVTENLKSDNYTFYGFLLKVLPFPLYGFFLKINNYRIDIQRQILKSKKNV